MNSPGGGSKAVWILPIVLAICGLMVLPASAVLATHTGASAGSGAGSSIPSVGGGGSGGAPGSSQLTSPSSNHFSESTLSSFHGQPRATPGQVSSAVQAINHAVETLEAKGANPSSIAMLQRIETGIADGRISPLVAQLPNINVFLGDSTSPNAAVASYYTSTPAPMGIGDFGVGTKTYELNTSAVLGSLTLGSYNATGGSLYQDSGAYYWQGLPATSPGNPYDSGIQLNTVLANVTYPGSSTAPLGYGVFWTQNVPEFFGNSLTFLDNVWNFSAPGATMDTGTLYSYDGVLVPGDFYYDYGPTIPVAFPMTMNLYNNASVNSVGQDVLTYGYRVVEGTGSTATVYSGTYDTVVFNSQTLGFTLKPQFRVDGFGYTPSGAYFDSELVFCGPADGSNAVITNVTGNMSMAYLNSSGKTWDAPTSAYDYGTNTGETAVGVAATWKGTTVDLSQGPSLLYGLWGTTGGVPSGADRFAGQITPNYGFVFIGEYDHGTYFPAYTPTNATGAISTFLPPSLPAPYTAYALEAYADEYANLSTSFSVPQTSFAVTLTSSPKTLNAPLYMNGEAQATALVTAVTGAATSPYTFSNLILKVDPYAGYYNATFNLLNDWGFPIFNLVYATGLSTPIVVNHVAQGPNWGNNTFYTWPYFGYYQYNISNGSQEFVDYGGVGDTFSNLNLPCYFSATGLCLGGVVSLWGTSGVTVENVNATYGSAGVWASTTSGTTVENSTGYGELVVYSAPYFYYYYGTAFTIAGSTGSVGWNITARAGGIGVFDMGGTSGTFTYLNSSFYGLGMMTFWANDTTVTNVNSEIGGHGVEIQGGTGVSVTDFSANYNAAGIYTLNTSSDITISTGSATNYSVGVGLGENSLGVSVSGVSSAVWSSGVIDLSNAPVSVSGTSAKDQSVGVEGFGSTSLSATGTSAQSQSIAVLLGVTTSASITKTTVTNLSVGVLAIDTTGSSISGVVATNSTLSGLYSAAADVIDYYFTGEYYPFAAVVSDTNLALGVTNVTATTYPAAFFDEYSDGATVGDLNATGGWYGVVANSTENSLFTGLNTYKDWEGVLMQAGEEEPVALANTITMSRFVDSTSFGVFMAPGAEGNLVWDNEFVGNNGATSTYSAAHIQAFSAEPNDFYWCANYAVCLTGVGNYWADWHTYGPNGYLAPYAITGGVLDEFPIGPQETFTVTFTETGLSAGTNWSVTFNGVTHNSTTPTITFAATMGTFSYTLNGVSGYQLQSGSTGSVTMTGAPMTITVVYTSTQSLATNGSLDTFFSIALVIALIALILGLIALMMHRRKKPEPASAAPTVWTPPSGAAGGTGTGSGASGGGGSNWSEGTGPSGGGNSQSPPSSS